ncbi:hypothetical protein G5V65_16260 [Rhodobacter sp. HX-7-19]|uniref:Uncharacterized protein n=1 Tax=Paragemmobacter kunshanensis TaxID=2583234 RepID=A0A6M1TWB5_9RHOB|nr:hypothetical protein [Rhodobacter kunshanensis]NGQ92450.1 hypothetical protein [Rhodobacter kunshanensis]
MEVKTKTSRSSPDLGVAERASKAQTVSSRPPNLARWFWGFFFLMAAITLALAILAAARLWYVPPIARSEIPADDRPMASAPSEHSASELDSKLKDANKVALEAVTELIDPLLDGAYAPVYEAIPIYADHHYSVWGEYAELGAAALGDVGAKLQEMLFDGLDSRLRVVGQDLDRRFDSLFETELTASVNDAGMSDLGPLTKRAIDNAISRMAITVPVSTATAIGTAATIKAVASTMAKKIASKLAVKATAKAGGKWAATIGGAGTGALACSWTGPGAGLCAAVGGVGAWLIADYGIVKLDEYWNRTEFEADLRAMIDEQKAADKVALAQALKERAESVQGASSEIVQDYDFTIRELSGVGNAEVCRGVEELRARYEPLRMNLRARTPEVLANLRISIKENSGDLSLGPIVREMEGNLKAAAFVSVGEVRIQGNLPEHFRADRDVSGSVFVEGAPIPFARRPASEIRGFNVSVASGKQIGVHETLNIGLSIEQHLRVRGNRFFAGSVGIDAFEAIGTADGLDHRVQQQLMISNYANAQRSGEFAGAGKAAESTVDLSIRLIASPLPELKEVVHCQ